MKLKITHDVYEISERVKDIDRDYYVVYDTSKGRFEVHNTAQIGSSYCLTLPYLELDERSLRYIRKTQSVNIEEILGQIENDNSILESAITSSALSVMHESIEENMRR